MRKLNDFSWLGDRYGILDPPSTSIWIHVSLISHLAFPFQPSIPYHSYSSSFLLFFTLFYLYILGPILPISPPSTFSNHGWERVPHPLPHLHMESFHWSWERAGPIPHPFPWARTIFPSLRLDNQDIRKIKNPWIFQGLKFQGFNHCTCLRYHHNTDMKHGSSRTIWEDSVISQNH